MNKFSLENHPKIKSGFETPADYFDNLPKEVMSKINSQKPKKVPVFTLKRIGLAVAAILILALVIPFFLNNSTFTNEPLDTIALENYLAYQSGVSSYDLINLMDVSELEAIQVDMALEEESVEDLLTSNPNFENYIID